jgi:(p)ppGpp synthase/HD superfamily hydrolase
MEMQKSANSEEFLETVKVDLFPDKVYVFTPKGDIMRLPRGATAVDFAYAVHTDVGNRCVATKIDRRLVPLKTTLNNGVTVEILTTRGAKPNPTWVNFVTTAKARNAIRAYLKGLKRDEARELGRRLLSQALRPYSLNLRRLRKAQTEILLNELQVKKMEDVYEQLGLGERLAPILAGMLAQQEIAENGDGTDQRMPLDIAGAEGLVVSYAHCCNPIPGDEILGFMSSGRGIVIHRTSCNNVVGDSKNPTKWIPVDWQRGIKGEFQSEIHVRTMNRVGLLAEVAGRISATQSNIDNVTVEADGDASTLSFRLNVRDRRHLAQVIRSIRANPGVVRVSRTAG